ncbi:MAG: phage portal protein family protein [Myxococcota bacterium]
MATRRNRHQSRRPARATGARALRVATGEISLEKVAFGNRTPRDQNQRTYYGRSLSLDRIEQAIRRAAAGAMIDITDLGREMLSLDGHLTGLVQKRLNRAAAIGYRIVANDGGGEAGYDIGRANERADFVRRQLVRIPLFRERLTDISWGTWDGRAAEEIDWQVASGRDVGDSKLAVGWRVNDLYWIHARRLSFSQNRELVVIDSDGERGDFRPAGFSLAALPEKFIVSTPRLFADYPEREGLLLRCLYWSFFQRLSTRERLQLMEIFGAPWRLAYTDSVAPINEESMLAGFQTLASMSSRSAGLLPQGVKAMIVQPAPGSGTVHKEAIEDARFVLSKLVLGSTGTTDAVPTGLGSSIGDAHLSEEDLIIAGDLLHRADVIEHQLTDRIIELNYGPEELAYAPKFQFDIRAVLDRGKEIANLKAATESGLRIPLEQAYELTGYRAPRKDEAYLAMVQPAAEAGMPGLAPRPMIVWPAGEAPPPGDLAIEPDVALNFGDTPPGVPGLPGGSGAPAGGPADRAPQAPAAPIAPEEPSEPAAPAMAMPFESPSGLSAEERDLVE